MGRMHFVRGQVPWTRLQPPPSYAARAWLSHAERLLKKASTTAESNLVPLSLRISAHASSSVQAGL